MNNNGTYDKSSAQSISNFAKQLTGKTLSSVRYLPADAQNLSNKGMLGSMVEEYFFQYMPGSNKDHEPDFNEAGVELKVTGVLQRNKPKNHAPYKAKERLVLTMISYINLADETWETSSFLKKCRLMLILFYLYEKNLPPADLRFVMEPLLWEFPKADLEIIEQDWLKIQQTVLDGRAHELSEGDTFYLGACRKGSGGVNERLREQPFSDTQAKARAFSLKPSYMNRLIDEHWSKTEEKVLIKTAQEAEQGLETIVMSKFKNFVGKTVDEIAREFNFPPGEVQAKNYLADLTMKILGVNGRAIPEFEKAGIVPKTIRLQVNGTPKEAISFPTFNFIELSNQNWEESDLFNLLAEKKFFFAIYQYDDSGSLRFKKAMFWNMPYEDRLTAESAWNITVDAVTTGEVYRMPKISDDMVIHVRPHGKNKLDTLPLPNGKLETKRCFWLNQKYLARELK